MLAGAVYQPLALTLPALPGLIDHVTAGLVVLMVMATGGSNVIVAEADLFVSVWLLAVIVTVCWLVMLAGAVYSPAALIVPVPAGLIVQVTAVLMLFVTVAVSC